jgi:tripartite-type tricarboxylate transporter receptor subunit TctC
MQTIKKIHSLGTLLALLLVTFTGISYAEMEYPTKPVTILIPYAPGGTNDLLGRLISETARKYFPQPFIIVNRPGASGTTAVFECVRSKPDGYTLALPNSSEASSSLHIVPAQYGIDSYTVISHIGKVNLALCTSGPWKTVKEIVDYSKKNPDNIKMGVATMGGTGRLCGVNLMKTAGLKWKEVPFQGSGPTIIALLGNHVDVACLAVSEIINQYKAGGLKILCVFSDQKDIGVPEVPTIIEEGFKGLDIGHHHFIITPNGVSTHIREKLAAAMKRTIEDPEFQERARSIVYTAYYQDGETSQRLLKEWYKKSGELFDLVGMRKK